MLLIYTAWKHQKTFSRGIDQQQRALTHFMPLVYFDTPWKHQKTSGFQMFLGDIKRDQWHEMG